jgi:hypothetical protein
MSGHSRARDDKRKKRIRKKRNAEKFAAHRAAALPSASGVAKR